MRSLVLAAIFSLVFALCSCSRPSKEPASVSPEPQELKTSNVVLPEPLRTLSSDLTIIKNTSRLPDSCKAAFVALSRQSRFEMAEPGEKFQVGDVVFFHLPWRRLVFGGVSSNRCLVHYERGGRGHSYYAVLFGISPDGKATFLWGGAGSQTESDWKQLRSDIASGKFKALGETETGW